ncbi:MAG: hypothetical protein HYT89_03885 [Candidatus Omnitrophica bacterium]|nr:hypothetical protein [Candidatus Omnitrophota bacterium]
MTYILGWKTCTNVFIAADSALHWPGPDPQEADLPNLPTSSFGEKVVSTSTDTVREAMLKLVNIDEEFIIGIAGGIKKALDVIEVFKTWTKYCNDPKEALTIAINSCGPYDKEEDLIGLICGYMGNNNQPVLISYNHDGKKTIIGHSDFVNIGSLDSRHSGITQKIVNTFLQKKLVDQHMLVAVTSLLQSYGIFSNLMQGSVGGVFIGISLGTSGVKWQEDTLYVLYDPPNFFPIMVAVRQNILCVKSAVTKDVRTFSNYLNSPNFISSEDFSLLKKKTEDFFCSGRAFFYVFLSLKDRIITVVKTNNIDNKYFRIVPDGKGTFKCHLLPALREKIFSNLDSVDDAVPFRLNWLNA